MKIRFTIVSTIAAMLSLLSSVSTAETFPVIKNKTVLAECTDCHMAFPPQTLTAKSWRDMISHLSTHFGESITLDAAITKNITAYYVKYSSDKSNIHAAKKWRQKTRATRITEASRFIKKHRSCAKAVWTQPEVNSRANCQACHKTMQKNGSTRVNLSFLPKKLRNSCDSGE